MRGLLACVIAVGAGCSQILGLTAPTGQPADATPSGDFTLQVTTPTPRVPQGGFDFLAVTVAREGFTAPLTIDIPAPPPGVTVTPAMLDGSATTGNLTLTGAPELAVGSDLSLTLVASGGGISHDLAVTAVVTFKPGIPDPGFGSAGDGVVVVPQVTLCLDITVAPNNAITAAADIFGAVGSGGVFRITGDGQLDATFGGGVISIPGSSCGSGCSPNLLVYSIARQSSGDVVVAGRDDGDPGSTPGSRGRLVSFALDGTPVAMFGSGNDRDFLDNTLGYDIGSATASNVVALPDDELMVVAAVENAAFGNTGQATLVRQGTSGNMGGAGTFGTTDTVPTGLVDFLGGADIVALDTSTGSTTYVVGTARVGSAQVPAVVHVLADGSFDAGFGSNGVVLLPIFGDAVAVQADGNILVGGSSTAAGSAAVVERLRPDGTPDPSFGSAGVANLAGPFAGTTAVTVQTLAVQVDGRIVAWADSERAGAASASTVLRLLPDGTLDPTYATGGVFDGSVVTSIGNLRIAPNGDAVLCGEPFTGGAAIERLTF